MASAHFRASAIANSKNVLGSFTEGHNRFIYDSITKLVMEQRDSGLFQVLYKNNQVTEARRFDIVFGSRHAQTSLYWLNGQTFELPVSYYRSVNAWGTSPGFSSTIPKFTRMIGIDCFECHSSYITHKQHTAGAGNYFNPDANAAEAFEKNSLVAGIGCQRCHGPAGRHVEFHRQNPGTKTPAFLVSHKTLNRQQQLDQCAVCHSGNDKRKLQSRFLFRPGDMLARYFLPAAAADSTTPFDVHGNQFNLLKQSACFLKSSSMTCSSCHDPHGNANEPVARYSQKCMGCHSEATKNYCTVKPAAGVSLQDNCIDCHMPKEASDAISFQVSGNAATSSYILRSHRIAVYKSVLKK
jgi:predicted CXXCH cytochrome family protein